MARLEQDPELRARIAELWRRIEELNAFARVSELHSRRDSKWR
jgi:hypothetical protein